MSSAMTSVNVSYSARRVNYEFGRISTPTVYIGSEPSSEPFSVPLVVSSGQLLPDSCKLLGSIGIGRSDTFRPGPHTKQEKWKGP